MYYIELRKSAFYIAPISVGKTSSLWHGRKALESTARCQWSGHTPRSIFSNLVGFLQPFRLSALNFITSSYLCPCYLLQVPARWSQARHWTWIHVLTMTDGNRMQSCFPEEWTLNDEKVRGWTRSDDGACRLVGLAGFWHVLPAHLLGMQEVLRETKGQKHSLRLLLLNPTCAIVEVASRTRATEFIRFRSQWQTSCHRARPYKRARTSSSFVAFASTQKLSKTNHPLRPSLILACLLYHRKNHFFLSLLTPDRHRHLLRLLLLQPLLLPSFLIAPSPFSYRRPYRLR